MASFHPRASDAFSGAGRFTSPTLRQGRSSCHLRGFAVHQFASGFVSSPPHAQKGPHSVHFNCGDCPAWSRIHEVLAGIRLALTVLAWLQGFTSLQRSLRLPPWSGARTGGKPWGSIPLHPPGLVSRPLMVRRTHGIPVLEDADYPLGFVYSYPRERITWPSESAEISRATPKAAGAEQIIPAPSFWLVMSVLLIMAVGGSVGLFTVMPSLSHRRTRHGQHLGKHLPRVCSDLRICCSSWGRMVCGQGRPKRAWPSLLRREVSLIFSSASQAIGGSSFSLHPTVLTGALFPGLFTALSGSPLLN